MVANPIYAGPVYETVPPPPLESLTKTNSTPAMMLSIPQSQYSSLDRGCPADGNAEHSQLTQPGGTSHSSNHYISEGQLMTSTVRKFL